MPSTPNVRPTTPPTVWLARGRHTGSRAAEEVVRQWLRRRKDDGGIDDFAEPAAQQRADERVFEARWRVEGSTVTVRARLALSGTGDWTLAAEAERPWDPRWPSPAELFWPSEPDAGWDRDPATGARLGGLDPLPDDDKAMRHLLKDATGDGWAVHVVVHEAMTTDQRGQRPLGAMLPPGLRHRVVEHRAAPHQLRMVNWALRGTGVEVPRGGAVVLPGSPVPPDYDPAAFSVRTVFLDGTEPAELIAAVTRYAALDRPLPEGAEDAVTALRERWTLLTLEEELARERALVAMYAEALEAMTKSRDLYREAAERANEALAAYREAAELPPPRQPSSEGSPLQSLTRTFTRLKESALSLRPSPAPAPSRATERSEHSPDSA
ncbi:hypothetical protein Stsp02_29840 [Streptomyces sp. NBRC 14336]|uniref:hypothetical protein n=1 Tax=Streptomyces sp. NBRC 14336 TaxID=3030992 RepID=UPI0024A07C68|nr:hypothetical protein [Streptomyces sp. NBRC 14336]WBO82126.1 hypothetical protein SBE_006026 [Streptomyces sp. SBE_14.2]GLW47322.1 hypothetical protein Stsp02_29840 [Streptomyces sp. NBRC 14336]